MYKYISYVSEQSHSISNQDLEGLLQKSRSKNSTKGITGILIYFEGVFTQFLEGPEQAIDTLYNKITADRRHKNMRELFSGESNERFYSDWSMAFKSLNEQQAEKMTGYKPIDKALFFESETPTLDHPGVMLLKSFVEGLHFY